MKKRILQTVAVALIVINMIALVGCSSQQTSNTATLTSTSAMGTPQAGAMNPPGGSSSSSSTAVIGTAAYTQSSQSVTKSNQCITASSSNESAIKVSSSGVLSLTGMTIKTTGSTTSDDSSNFYGLNAGVLAESASKITLDNCAITTTG